MKLFIKLLAIPCYICPLCILSRVFPDSKFSKGMEKYSKVCPFCAAYKKSKTAV